jgi:hypothetical protein
MNQIIDIDTLTLAKGAHDCDDPAACLMEARALLLGRKKTDDRPPGTSPILHNFGISLNDAMADEKRQQLKRFLPRDGVDPLGGTEGDGQDEARGYLALDWLVRTYTPAFLDLRPELAGVAAELRSLRRIVDLSAAQSAGPVVRSAKSKATAGDTAGAAVRDAAWAAALAAAGDAAGDAAGAAVRAAAGDAAGDAVRAAAWDAALAAAGAAAGDAAGAAAGDAARAALAPTVDRLQDSAIELYAAMINPAAAS